MFARTENQITLKKGKDMERQTLKTCEVKQLTGQSLEAIRGLVKKGVLPNISGTRRVLIPRSAVERYLNGDQE